ncbi:hypothetical protein ACFLTP_09165 [Chloroflexota bacterium]
MIVLTSDTTIDEYNLKIDRWSDKVLKVFGVGILDFLLFRCLNIFSLALWIDGTALNPRFMISEINRLDFALLV